MSNKYLVTIGTNEYLYHDKFQAEQMALRYPSTFVELVAKPVPLSEDEMRAKFEAAIKAKYPHADFARHPDGKYQDYSAWDMWDGWQAAYKSMNEDK